MAAIPNPDKGGADGRNSSDFLQEIYGYLRQYGKLGGYGAKVRVGNYGHDKRTRLGINFKRDTPVKS
ncbi:hypothetical protein DL770_010633 [Monosporascus sp. CRB-9-2]|nr:hypothetical protein DL770_010633 [Monosporascus sp. CRB-9-2]